MLGTTTVTIDRKIKRTLLKPLTRPRENVADRNAVIKALERLDDRALGEGLLSQITEAIAADNGDRNSRSWKDPETANRMVILAKALFASRRISRPEYVFYASFPVEVVHEDRWMDGAYDEPLAPISQQIDALRREYGLSADQYWPVGKGPKDYEHLNKQYEFALDDNFVKALREFGLNDLADLIESNRSEFDRLRERGRRAVFHKNEIKLALKDVVLRYEEDAHRAASAKAYAAAITLLGAGLEGLLLLRCIRSKQKSRRVAMALPAKQRPRFPDDPTTWTFETLIETCLAAGWLPQMSTSVAEYDSAGLAHILRLMRNYVHPGRLARERPWSEVDEDDFRDAEAIYVALMSKIVGNSSGAERGAKQSFPADSRAAASRRQGRG